MTGSQINIARRAAIALLIISAMTMLAAFTRVAWLERHTERLQEAGLQVSQTLDDSLDRATTVLLITSGFGVASCLALVALGLHLPSAAPRPGWYFRNSCCNCGYSRKGLHGFGDRCPECGKTSTAG